MNVQSACSKTSYVRRCVGVDMHPSWALLRMTLAWSVDDDGQMMVVDGWMDAKRQTGDLKCARADADMPTAAGPLVLLVV